jgi:hypothetical protein
VSAEEVLRAELVEELARLVNEALLTGKEEAQSALDQIDQLRSTLAKAGSLNDFREDLEAAEWTLLRYLLT